MHVLYDCLPCFRKCLGLKYVRLGAVEMFIIIIIIIIAFKLMVKLTAVRRR